MRAALVPGPPELLPGPADAVVDLCTAEGAALVRARWRFTRAGQGGRLRRCRHDLGPSSQSNRTYDIEPHLAESEGAGGRDLGPAELELRLSTGRCALPGTAPL